MKKKILLVSHEMTYTGAPQSLLRMADVLLNNGYEVFVWTLVDGPLKKEYVNNGVKVMVIVFPEKQEQYVSKIKEYDLVIANTIFCAEFARFSQQYVRTVLYIREAQNIPWLLEKNFIDSACIVDAKNMVCVSEYAKVFIEENYGLHNITVLHNFIDDYFLKDEVATDDIIDFIVSGTVEPRKGQDVAIKAFLQLPEKYREKARLHIVGNMPRWASEYHKMLKFGTQKDVIYHGEYKNRDKLYKLYRAMDVFLVTSTDESCSLVALEAAMLGKPLVVTENTGAKYMVSEDCILPTGDVEMLSSCMQDCILHYGKWKYYGETNRKNYLKYANKKSYEKKLISYIGEVMEKEEISSENKIKVSVVVPVYNMEKYLVQCMESLVNQSLKEIEIICVNDGSRDSSLEILRAYEKKDARVRVISGENYGYGHAMNIGIDAAKGEFLGIVEPDDYADLHMFQILYQRAIATGVDIVKADFYRFYGDGEEQRNVYNSTARIMENYNRIFEPKKDKECFRFIMNTWSGIYRMDFLNKYHVRHNETPGASFQDNGFWFKGFCQAEKITFINKPLLYNRRDNPNSSVNNREKIYCANEEYADIRKFLSDNPELEKEFLPQFMMKKYHTYLFTLERVGWQYKQEFLKSFSEEFKQAEEQGELCKAAFTPQEWTNLHWIMNNPEEYYEKVVKKEIEISVIIPVYNAEKYLRQCLESLETQCFVRFEVICIDDGSTDSSRQIIEDVMKRDKRFSLVIQQNQGAGAARNRGMELAKGEYLLFLDADDYFAPDMLLHAWKKIKETESDICVINSWQHDEETGTIQPCNYALRMDAYPNWRPFRVQDMSKNPFRNFMGWAWDKLYLKRFLVNNQLKFQEQRTSNDMYFTYMSLFKADRITTLEERLIYQRRNIPGSLSQTRERSWECFYNALMAMKQELADMGLYERNSRYFVNYALHSCLWNLKTLPEETAEKLRVKIAEEWADTLDIRKMKESEAEFSAEYEEYQLILQKGKDGLRAVREKYRAEQERVNKNIKKQGFSPTEMISVNEAAEYQIYMNKIKNSKLFQVAWNVFKWMIKVRRKIKGMWRKRK